MNLYTDIKFSCNLIKNATTIITYSGDLFKKNSDSVTIVYGYTDNWNNTTEQKMVKTKLGFVAQLNLLDYDKINFCFRNSNYEWDNNNNQNYGCNIEEKELDFAFIINENIIEDIIHNLFKNNISEIKVNKVKQILTELKHEQTLTSHAEINEIVNSALYTIDEPKSEVVSEKVENAEPITSVNSVVAEVENIEPVTSINTVASEAENIEPVTSVNSVVAEIENIEPELEIIDNEEGQVAQIIPDINDIINFEFDSKTNSYFDIQNTPEEIEIIEDLVDIKDENIEETLINKVVENTLTSDIENVFNVVYENKDIENTQLNDEPITYTQNSDTIINNEVKKDILNFDMDGLVNEILSPIIASSAFAYTSESIENISEDNLDCSDLIKTIDSKFEQLKKGELEEAPLMDVLNIVETTPKETTTSNEPVSENHYLVSPRSLGTFYIIRKKIKLIFYKIFGSIPRFLLGDYEKEN